MLLKPLILIALQQLQESFGLRRLRVSNEREAEAALWSACESFQRHCRAGELADAKSPEELAAHLLRIARNRAQRRRRQDNKMRDATRRWTTRNQEGQTAPLDPEDHSAGPDQEAFERELAAYLREAIDSIREELQGRRHASDIVQAYLEDMEQPQAAIASALGINQATVSRWLEWFHDRIRQMLEEGGMT
jgi:DNA-directed RNA polymerase specialized sigma24 family protein